MKWIKSIHDFLVINGEKMVTLKGYFWSAYYRWSILKKPMKEIEKMMGVRGEESSKKESIEIYRRVKLLAFHVRRLTQHTPWESKCLVQALTLRKLLLREHINCTIYLGIMQEDDKMKAHAWLRCGEMYPMGGNGEGFRIVTRFKSW